MRLVVQDLHAITPAEYLEFGDAVVHTLSYQMARHFNAPVRGVYVANPGYMLGAAGVPRGAVISSVDGKPVADARGLRGRSSPGWPTARASRCATRRSTTRTAARRA